MPEPAAIHSPRVLVVDDEPQVVTFIDRVLRLGGYDTCSATGGREALQIAGEALPFDLLLTDVCMPGMAGYELSRILRMRQPDLRVLYLTGFNDALFDGKGTLWDGEAYLDKPTTPGGLLQAVSLLLYGTTHQSAPSTAT